MIHLKSVDIPLQKWTLITIYFRPDQIMVFFDNTDCEQMTIAMEWSPPIRFLPGTPKRGKAGQFGIYSSLTPEQASQIFEAGVRGTPDVPAIVYFTSSDIADYRIEETDQAEELHFASVLLKNCRIDVLLPIFAHV
jgi:hypothetical protein